MFMAALRSSLVASISMRPLAMLLTLAACSAGPGAAAPAMSAPASATDPVTTIADTTVTTPNPDTESEPEPEREAISLSLSLYVVSDGDDDDSGLGTRRSVADVEAIVADIAPIWAQADITFDPVRVLEIDMPGDVLNEIATTGGTDAFFAQVGRTFELPDAGAVNGFYVREAAGVNGFTPIASRVFFVVDKPTVNDERVSSHEIGHILGLHHDPFDPDRLMFSGTNGEMLNEVEQDVARYAAQGVLDGVR